MTPRGPRRPDLYTAAFQARPPCRTREARREKEDVAVRLRPGGKLGEVEVQLVVVPRVDGREGFRPDQARHLAHDVELARHVRAGREVEAAHIRVQQEQLAGGGHGDGIGPGLVDLLDEI